MRVKMKYVFFYEFRIYDLKLILNGMKQNFISLINSFSYLEKINKYNYL